MEAATLPAGTEEGAPVEEGAEATRSSRHLFQHSAFVHAGAGARECENRENGKCKDPEHFHAWLTLPNSLQHADIQDKARAAKARRQLAMRDPEADAYATLEADLDLIMRGDRDAVISGLAEQGVRERLNEYVAETRADERFADYGQHREEWQRLRALPEDERPEEDWVQAEKSVNEFTEAIEERLKSAREAEESTLRDAPDDVIRERLRTGRIEAESQDVYTRTYYTWIAFVGTRQVGNRGVRAFARLDDLRGAAPEAVELIDRTMEDLELRLSRGDAAGN